MFSGEMSAMWTVVQLAVCVIFLLVAAFVLGKKLGQRQYNKIQQEMKDLELYFKSLMDDMEMVAEHNMKVLETSSSDIRELLNIADKKCLYANDLLKELDESVDALKKRNLGVTNIDSAADKKFRKEIHEALSELLKKVVTLNERVRELEMVEQPENSEELSALVTAEVARQLNIGLMCEIEPRKSEPRHVVSAGNVFLERAPEKTAERASERVIPLKSAVRESFPTGLVAGEKISAMPRSSSGSELKMTHLPENGCIAPVKKTDLEKAPRVAPPGSPVHEVLELFNSGVTLPQIARNLNMGKGEIELILKIYGESEEMRKIM